MLTIRAMSNAQGYSARHLEHSDYYDEDKRIAGRWHGRGSQLLALSGEVQSKDFDAVRLSLDPRTGEFLRQRQSADRRSADGATTSQGRNLYDFTFSAPKSVSIMASVGDDERLAAAHRLAVAEALQELESCAATRVRQNGANSDRTTGNLVLAVYHHDTSRELDPQLHTHAVAANMTWDGTEGRWKALQASGIYERRAYLTEVYRNVLAREVSKLGYEIEDRRQSNGHDLGFEIRGVSNDLLERFSQRSHQRDSAIDLFTTKNSRPPTDNEIAILVRESRADKLTEISTAEVTMRQKTRLRLSEDRSLNDLHKTAVGSGLGVIASCEGALSSVNYAQEHIFERVSVASEHELLAEALRHGRGRIDLDEAKGALRCQQASGVILRAGKEIATRETLDRERAMIGYVNRGVGRFEPLGKGDAFVASDRLRPEQNRAVEFVLRSRDLAVNIRGAAGTGKTATLQDLRRGLTESGREVLAVAPTMSAVEELRRVGFDNAITIPMLLADHDAQRKLRGKALVVDEAGMVSGRQMSELFRLAERESARLIFSGDTMQIRSVEASDALRILEKESQLKSVSLTQVQRQTSAEYREAIEELRRNPEGGFDKLDDIGAIRQVPWMDRARTVADAWRETELKFRGTSKQPTVLVVCPTHEDIGIVTDAIRTERKRAGELGRSISAERLVPRNYTTAQKRSARALREGQVLVFHRSAKGIARNEILDVVRVENRRTVVRNAAGVEREVTGKQAGCFEVFERRSIDIAENDRILLIANRRDAGFRAVNGELATVSRVDDQGRIHLADGRTLPRDYKHFEHGYAVTAHRSQGKTVDAVVISGDAMKKELFYVAASRGRESVTVVTSDKGLLRESVARSGERQSASELLRKIKQGANERTVRNQVHHRGLAAARAIALRAARERREIHSETPQPEHELNPVPPARIRQQEMSKGRETGIGR
jgi:conjugative relaxase-like TrwC/TraI family protein